MSIIDRLTTTDPATRPLRRRTKEPEVAADEIAQFS